MQFFKLADYTGTLLVLWLPALLGVEILNYRLLYVEIMTVIHNFASKKFHHRTENGHFFISRIFIPSNRDLVFFLLTGQRCNDKLTSYCVYKVRFTIPLYSRAGMCGTTCSL